MILKKWLPWHLIVKYAARKYDFLDPYTLLARLRQFGQPSEVLEPVELLRAGLIFHARGVINTRAIQYNLDWIWPYWVVKQFTPTDASFIPRGFSFSHVNATHRNWTAVGHPQLPVYPVIDPRGLVTPLLDSWSVDAWILSESGSRLIPSRQASAEQHLNFDPDLQVITRTRKGFLSLDCRASVSVDTSARPILTLRTEGSIQSEDGWLILAVRPYNPEGVQFIDHIQSRDNLTGMTVNHTSDLVFDRAAEKILFSSYDRGDVAMELDREQTRDEVDCPIGMATAAAFFPIRSGHPARVNLTIGLDSDETYQTADIQEPVEPAAHILSQTAELALPDTNFCFLFEAAKHTLLMLTAKDVYPGPYTYRRFWFRDACLMINALLGLGSAKRSRDLLAAFPARQTMTGYYRSQEGEWDSNGQVLWLAGRYSRLTGDPPDDTLSESLIKGGRWILQKLRNKKDGKRHDGLLPAGFSAEHLGPNDYYYWDDFWAVAGLDAAAQLAADSDSSMAKKFEQAARRLQERIFDSISDAPGHIRTGAMPASPYRRMDAGAIGSLVADYPLQITGPNDPLVMKTVDYLMGHCFHNNAFFQDMIHSGLNAYLTLDIAQTLLRSGDPRFRQLIETVAGLASPTGQWPEAINPLTGGGCMGDGQHGWAAAEWIMMMRSLFVREEKERLILGSGLFPEWLKADNTLMFGPTQVPGGTLTVRFINKKGTLTVSLDAQVKGAPLPCRINVPGYRQKDVTTAETLCRLEPET